MLFIAFSATDPFFLKTVRSVSVNKMRFFEPQRAEASACGGPPIGVLSAVFVPLHSFPILQYL